MSGKRQEAKRAAKGGAVKVDLADRIAGDMVEHADEFVKALLLFYEKIDADKKLRIERATDELKAVLDELPPGPLVLAAVNHIHDEIIKRSQDIGRAYAEKEGKGATQEADK